MLAGVRQGRMLGLIFVSSLTLSLWGTLWGLHSHCTAPRCPLGPVVWMFPAPPSFCF